MNHWNCRQKQRDVLGKMLHLNSASTPGKDPGDLYKVLILDRFSRDIIAPLLRVNDLRRHGVTLHLALEAERQPIPDVPAVYLVQPTQANIERIVKDAAAGLYEQVHVNFTSSLPSNLLQQLAQGMVKADAASKIAKLYDQYVSFIALEPNMFSLGMPDAYLQLNDPAAMDTHIEAVVTSIVDGLFALCVTLGVVPIIRCPRGGVAEHVATILDGKLRDALRGRNSLLSEGMSGLSATLTRPILCLFDRNFDLTSTLCHGWTYKPLVHDVLGLHLNRVTLPAEPVKPGAAGALAAAVKAVPNPSLDVDEHDFFWEACGTHAFPTMAEEVDTQVKRYKAAVDSISKQSAAPEGAYVDPDELLKRNTKDLMAAVSSLPELQEQKKTLDKHTRMAHALLAAIKTRGLDAWHSTGEDVLAGKADLATVTKLVAGPRGTPADRLRLAIIWLLMCPGVPSDSDYSELETALRNAGCDTTALSYVRTLKRNNLVGFKTGQEGTSGMPPASAAAGSSTALFTYVAKTVKDSVNTLLAVSRQAPLTLAVEALMDGKQGSVEHDTYAVFDPKAPAGRAGPERAKGPFREAIVFMIGGGSYLERETIVTWAAKANASSVQGGGVLGAVGGPSAQRHVLYGATEMLSGEQTLTQLAELGRLSGLGPGHISLQPAAAGQVANGR